MDNKLPIQDCNVEETIKIIYDALMKKGYDPISQFAGYVLSEDPLYIPDCDNARAVIGSVDRYDILLLLVKYYFENKLSEAPASNGDEKNA